MSIQHQSMKRTRAFNYSQSYGKEDDFTTAALHRLLPCTSGKPPFVIQCPRADPRLQTMLPDTYSTNTVTTYSPFWSAFVGPLNPQAQGQNKGRNGKPLAKSTAQEDEEQDKIQGLEEVVQN